jgi:Spy/CpxP family protein refolding chaperone
MKQIVSLIAALMIGLALNAQNSGTNSDTTHHHAFHQWGNQNNHNGNDSLHRHYQRFGHGDQSYARNNWQGHRRNQMHGNRFHRGNHGGGMYDRGWAHFTPEQRKQAQAINVDYRKQQKALYNNNSMTLGEYKSKLAALQKDKKDKIMALLTPEQKNQMAQWKKKREENAQVHGAARLERMRIELNLTDAQASTIKSQQQVLRKQMKDIMENDNLFRDQKRDEMKSLIAKNKENLKTVLTPQQYEQFENMNRRPSMDK